MIPGTESALFGNKFILMSVCVSDAKVRRDFTHRWNGWERNQVYGIDKYLTVGTFFVFHFANSSVVPLTIKGFGSFFHAHGLGLVQGESSVIVAAVNHAIQGDTIELFDYIPGSTDIVHYETVSSDLLYSINDVVPIDRKRFYATNDSKFVKGILFYIEKVFGMSWSSVVYRDGNGQSK